MRWRAVRDGRRPDVPEQLIPRLGHAEASISVSNDASAEILSAIEAAAR